MGDAQPDVGDVAKFKRNRRLSLVPVGRSSEMTLTSNWPHPNFVGIFFPVEKREISGSGFQAQWQTSRFATNLGEQFADAQKVDWDNLPAFSVAVSTPNRSVSA